MSECYVLETWMMYRVLWYSMVIERQYLTQHTIKSSAEWNIQLPTEHTHSNWQSQKSPTQNISAFPRYTLTKKGYSVKIRGRVVLNKKRNYNCYVADLPSAVQASLFWYLAMMFCICDQHLYIIYGGQWAPPGDLCLSMWKCRHVGHSALSSCIAESSEGLPYDQVADLCRPWPTEHACVTVHRQVALPRLPDIPSGPVESREWWLPT